MNNLIILFAALYFISGCNKSAIETVEDIDGNIYHTVKINKQVWMVENLKVTHYSNGVEIQHITNDTTWKNDITGAYSDFNNSIKNGKVYGHLYNSYAAANTRNLAPKGWHIATKKKLGHINCFCWFELPF